MFQCGGLGALFGRAKPIKASRGDGTDAAPNGLGGGRQNWVCPRARETLGTSLLSLESTISVSGPSGQPIYRKNAGYWLKYETGSFW